MMGRGIYTFTQINRGFRLSMAISRTITGLPKVFHSRIHLNRGEDSSSNLIMRGNSNSTNMQVRVCRCSTVNLLPCRCSSIPSILSSSNTLIKEQVFLRPLLVP